MRAAVIELPGKPLVIRDVPLPTIGPDDALVEVRASGVCFTDVRIADGMVSELPRIPGHEPVGVVAEIGAHVAGVRPGDRVGVHSLFTCGHCTPCRGGEEEACDIGVAAALAGLGVDGGYAEYMRAPARHIIPLAESLDFVDAAPLFCAGLTSYAGLRNGGITPGDKVAIIGVGGLGHLAISIAAALGAEVFAVTGSPDKVAMAQERGAVFAGPVGSVAEELARVGGARLVYNTSDDLSTVAALLPGVAKQATVVVAAGAGEHLPVTPGDLLRLQLRIVGTFFGSRQDMRDLLDLAERSSIVPQVERYRLEDVNDVHDRLRANRVRYRAVLELP